MLRYFFVVAFSFCFVSLLAQERCGTVALEKMLHSQNPTRETRDQFESWIKGKLSKKTKIVTGDRIASTGYVVPVVVHVIHNGETVGSGINISDAQILSQINVLNADFQRMNADTTHTPNEFKSVAGKFPITFVMAKQDPNGLATNGIVRVKGTKSSWTLNDNYTLKALSYWPAEDYLNIWITNLTGGLLGYTQLPVSSTLKGLELASDDRLTDGVVIDYQTYGTRNAAGGSNFNLLSEYALGRTTTHEVGHFFGLRHVWGDTFTCDTTYSKDYVYDTPVQDKDFNGTCPSAAQTDCGVHSMYDNYMNYTDDACMDIFSQGQVARMDVIINNSPRRASLLNSHGAQVPMPVANDAWAKTVLNPGTTVCGGSVQPSVLIQNYGTNTIQSVEVDFFLNGTLTETKTFSPLTVLPNADTAVSFSSVNIGSGASNVFAFKIIQTNGTTDGNGANDSLALTTATPVPVALPMNQTFNSLPTNWKIENPDGLTTWENISLTQNKHAMYLNFYDYDDVLTSDLLITPLIDLTTASVASLSFDYAYAMYSGGSNDRLRVWVTTTCDFSTSPILLFDKSGSALATAQPTSSRFVPTDSQWQTTLILLNQFIGQKIQIAFEGINAYGNDLYLDNVNVLNTPVTSLALNRLVSPSPVSCATASNPLIEVKNVGNTTINSFTTKIDVNGVTTTDELTNLLIEPGSSQQVQLQKLNFLIGANDVSVAVRLPNGIVVPNSPNDSLHTSVTVNASADIIPLRQTFDVNLNGWTSVSPDLGSIWHPVYTNQSLSMIYDAFENTNLGSQSWLVSPVLNFSKASKASMFFQTSYRSNSSGSESFQVFVSTDCGLTFPQLIYSSSGSSLSGNNTLSASWVPSSSTDWIRQFINLDTLVGSTNLRFAFVATNDDGNNLYLDNIEFYVDDDPSPLTVNSGYSVYPGPDQDVRVTFNLSERQLVRVQSYDMMGNLFSDDLLPDTLNQTYTLRFKNQPQGVYIIRVQTASSVSSTKVLLGF